MTNRGQQKLKPTPTGARLHYLRQCEHFGIYKPRHGVAANHCLKLGLVETVVELRGARAGEVVAWDSEGWQAWRLLGDFKIRGERLTDAGRAFLDKHMPQRSRPPSGKDET